MEAQHYQDDVDLQSEIKRLMKLKSDAVNEERFEEAIKFRNLIRCAALRVCVVLFGVHHFSPRAPHVRGGWWAFTVVTLLFPPPPAFRSFCRFSDAEAHLASTAVKQQWTRGMTLPLCCSLCCE